MKRLAAERKRKNKAEANHRYREKKAREKQERAYGATADTKHDEEEEGSKKPGDNIMKMM